MWLFLRFKTLRKYRSGQKWVYSCEHTKQFILLLFCSNYCIIFHMHSSKPTYAHPAYKVLILALHFSSLVGVFRLLHSPRLQVEVTPLLSFHAAQLNAPRTSLVRHTVGSRFAGKPLFCLRRQDLGGFSKPRDTRVWALLWSHTSVRE